MFDTLFCCYFFLFSFFSCLFILVVHLFWLFRTFVSVFERAAALNQYIHSHQERKSSCCTPVKLTNEANARKPESGKQRVHTAACQCHGIERHETCMYISIGTISEEIRIAMTNKCTVNIMSCR